RSARCAPLRPVGQGCQGDTPGEPPGVSDCASRGVTLTPDPVLDPVRTPLPPLQGGPATPRVTRADRQRAEDLLHRSFGRCPHEPRCEPPRECRALLAADLAMKRYDAEQRALAVVAGRLAGRRI